MRASAHVAACWVHAGHRLLQVNAGKCLPYAGSSNNPALGGCSPGYYAGGCCEDLTDCASCFAERFGAASCGWCAEGSKLNSGKCLTGALGRHVTRCDMTRCVATCCTAPRQCCTALQHVALRCDVARCVAARCGAATCLASAALGSLGQCEAGFFGRACCGDIKTCAYCSTGPERYVPAG